mmetsp:Transcript_10162/g.37822  ORF Transcript_10162/g.37822 Transcript_10162/m.37822 type:complete len:484 (-) Transcript_10162:83-1534(-)
MSLSSCFPFLSRKPPTAASSKSSSSPTFIHSNTFANLHSGHPESGQNHNGLGDDSASGVSEAVSFVHLSQDLLMHIFSFMSLSQIFESPSYVLSLNSRIFHSFRMRLRNGSFFREREKRDFVRLLFGDNDSNKPEQIPETSGSLPRTLREIDRGYPQLYHDCYYIQKRILTSSFCRSVWRDGLRDWVDGLTKDLDFAYECGFAEIVPKIVVQIMEIHQQMRENYPMLFSDEQIMVRVVVNRCNHLKYASKELRNNKRVVLESVKGFGKSLEYASEGLRADPLIVMEAVKVEGTSLQYASTSLKSNRDIVLAAVTQSGWALEFANPVLGGDREIVSAAVRRNVYALEFAAESLTNDRELIMEGLKSNVWILRYASEELRNDYDFAMQACRTDGLALGCFPPSLRNNRALVLTAVQQFGFSIQFASDHLRADRDIAMEACRQNAKLLQFVDPKLRDDPSIVKIIEMHEENRSKDAKVRNRLSRDV